MLSCMIVWWHPRACIKCVDLVRVAKQRIHMGPGMIWDRALRIKISLTFFILVSLEILETNASDLVAQMWHCAELINLL